MPAFTLLPNRTNPTTAPIPRRLLGVWAHPDDEAYLSSGLMAQVVDSGGDVTVVTATLGEHGTSDPAQDGTARFAWHRHGELAACLGEVGVTDLRVLGYEDGTCDRVPVSRGAHDIAKVICSVRPDVIVTFGPDGITGHPDHRAVSRWATEAWQRTGVGELLYATLTDEFVSEYDQLNRDLGMFDEYGLDGPVSVAGADAPIALQLHGEVLERKRRALAAHASQTDDLAALMGEDVYQGWIRSEAFRRPTTDELHDRTKTALVA